jgi:alpha-L-fucosidase
MNRTMKKCLLILLIIFPLKSGAQNFTATDSLFGATVLQKRTDGAMQKWRENRFGQFFHWGLYAVAGGEWKGKVVPGSAEWIQASGSISSKEYARLIDDFNPVKYDPEKWAKIARDMGVKYVILTTKHHEGFCLWPSKYSNFTVSSTPYKKDLLMPFVKAYNQEGIDVYFYYSILDWHHPDYRSTIKSEEDQKAFERYISFVKNQLKELVTNYPAIKGFWFDGQWEESYKKNAKLGYAFEEYCRSLKPGIILNNRVRTDARGNVDHDYNKRHFGDFDGSFERRLPSGTKTLDFDWEACMTVPENQWGYNKNWTGHLKTPYEVIEMIATCTSMGGNFVLNFGPQPDGDLRHYEKQLASKVGSWMKPYGKAIYGCDNAGFEKQDWGYYTTNREEDKVNMIVFNIPQSKQLKIVLPDGLELSNNSLLTDSGRHFPIEKLYGSSYYLTIGDTSPSEPFVITLNVKKRGI